MGEDGSKQEVNSDGKNSLDVPPFIRLFLGLLPFDVDATIEFVSSIQQEARETSWDSLFRRAASFGISLGAVSLLILIPIILLEGRGMSDVPFDITLFYAGLFGLLFILAFLKWFIKLMQSINEARSPIAYGLDDRWGIFLEFSLGVMILSLPVFLILEAFRPVELLAISLIGAVITGVTIAGFALILSSFARVKKVLSKRTVGKDTTLDEYANK